MQVDDPSPGVIQYQLKKKSLLEKTAEALMAIHHF